MLPIILMYIFSTGASMINSRVLSRFLYCLLAVTMLGLTGYGRAAAQCDPPGCEDIEFQNAQIDVELPGYPGCTVRLDYRWRQCPPPIGISSIEVWGMQIIGSSPACDGLENFFYPGGSPNWNNIKWGFREGYNAMIRKLFLQSYNSLPPSLNPHLKLFQLGDPP